MRGLKFPFWNAVMFNQNASLWSMCLLDVLVGETIHKFVKRALTQLTLEVGNEICAVPSF